MHRPTGDLPPDDKMARNEPRGCTQRMLDYREGGYGWCIVQMKWAKHFEIMTKSCFKLCKYREKNLHLDRTFM